MAPENANIDGWDVAGKTGTAQSGLMESTQINILYQILLGFSPT